MQSIGLSDTNGGYLGGQVEEWVARPSICGLVAQAGVWAMGSPLGGWSVGGLSVCHVGHFVAPRLRA